MKRGIALPKVLTVVLLIAPAMTFSVGLVQKNPPTRPPDANSPVMIWDVDPSVKETLPRNFRTTDDSLKAINRQSSLTAGLAELRASGLPAAESLRPMVSSSC